MKQESLEFERSSEPWSGNLLAAIYTFLRLHEQIYLLSKNNKVCDRKERLHASFILLKELNRTLSQVYKYGLYWHCNSSFLVMKKQKVKTTVFRMQIFRTGHKIIPGKRHE